MGNIKVYMSVEYECRMILCRMIRDRVTYDCFAIVTFRKGFN